eukprot:GEMP01007376.1.p1 GENE.GEMP01007376.1~~GEMP01007376.1.p1  ORF type:complete len:935 (+),score=173.58 GEMP01007376.1:33-2837(+)
MKPPWLEAQISSELTKSSSLPLIFDSKLRQAEVVREQVLVREQLGEKATLPSPCSEIYVALSPRYRPDTNTFLSRMKQYNHTSYVSCMVSMMLIEYPAPHERNIQGNFLPPPKPPVSMPDIRRSHTRAFCMQADPDVKFVDLKSWKRIVMSLKIMRTADCSDSGTGQAPPAHEENGTTDTFWKSLRTRFRDNQSTSDHQRAAEHAKAERECLDPRWVGAVALCFPKLVHLQAKNLHLDGSSLRILSAWNSLRHLTLSHNPYLQTKDLESLTLELLESIDVSHCSQLRSLYPLSHLPCLRAIDASHCEVLGVDEPPPDKIELESRWWDERIEDPVKDWLDDTETRRRVSIAPTSSALLNSHSVTKLSIHGCHGIVHLDLACPVEDLDLSYLIGLKSVTGHFPQLQSLDVSHCPEIEALDGGQLCEAAPQLTTLLARRCENLEAVDLRKLRKLEQVRLTRCPRLSKIKSLPRNLQYLDINGSEQVDDRKLMKMVDIKEPDDDAATMEVLGKVPKVLLQKVGNYEKGTACVVTDFWINPESKEFHYKLLPQASEQDPNMDCTPFDVTASQENDLYETKRIEGHSEHKILIVLPSDDRSKKFLPPALRRNAARAKYRMAQLEATAVTKRGTAIDPRDFMDAKEELGDAMHRASEEPISDLPLLRCVLPLRDVPDTGHGDILPDVEISCWLGCGVKMLISEYQSHELECPCRRILCCLHEPHGICIPRIGGRPEMVPCHVGVQFRNMTHHEEVELELQAALKTWQVERLTRAVTNVCGPLHPLYKEKQCQCESCILPNILVDAATARLNRLDAKVRFVAPILKRKNLTIDFENCEVLIEKEIKFETRKPPDASAALDSAEKRKSLIIIDDLAGVIGAFMDKMVIEGHTGSVDPPEYWQELADNRSMLICNLLEERNVPSWLVIPRGRPGGGAKVLVYPA